jgi:predicted transcriptional regulator
METQEATATDKRDVTALAADIISAYVSNNTLAPTELSQLIARVHEALATAATGPVEEPKEELKPAVPIRRSVTPDHIVCLEDGKTFKSLKRHLQTEHGLSPEQYRQRWGLRSEYPMVAPNYAAARSAMAKQIGLGQKRAESGKKRAGKKAA